jgi:hypothetical protein
MSWQGYGSLKEQDMESLVRVNTLVEELLIHESMLPPGLYVKLDTYHADLANAMEAKNSRRKAEIGRPEASADPATVEDLAQRDTRGDIRA